MPSDAKPAGMTVLVGASPDVTHGGKTLALYKLYVNGFFVGIGPGRGDGSTDDAPALQSAIDACRTMNRTLHIQDGRFLITKPLNWSDWLGVSVRGGRLRRARDSKRASLTPAVPLHRAHGFQSGDNLEHRVGVRAIVKPYVFGCLEKS